MCTCVHMWWWLSIFSAVFAVSIEQAKCITIFFCFLLTERTLLGLCVFPKKATKIQYSTMKLRVFIYIRVTRYVCVCARLRTIYC